MTRRVKPYNVRPLSHNTELFSFLSAGVTLTHGLLFRLYPYELLCLGRCESLHHVLRLVALFSSVAVGQMSSLVGNLRAGTAGAMDIDMKMII